MIISHQHRFVFFHNPKTAGISLRAVLVPYHDDPIPFHGFFRRLPFDYPLDFAHLRLWEITELFPAVMAAARRYRSLVFVRDPYRRLVSAVDQHFKTYYPDLPLPTMPAEQQILLIEAFCEEKLRLEVLRTDHRFVHFSPQAWYLQCNGIRLPGEIVPVDDNGAFITRGLETLGLSPRSVPHENRSRSDLRHVLSSPKIRAFVDDFYAEDFAIFAADPVLAHLVDHRSAARSGIAANPTRDRNDQTGTVLDPAMLTTTVLEATRPTAAGARRPPDVAQLTVLSAELDRAGIDLGAGRAGEAFERVRRVLAENPDYPRALGMLGQIAVFADHPAVGLAPLQRAFALDPRLEHRVWLALCLGKIGCTDDAVRVMSQAIGTLPPTPNVHSAVGSVFHALGRYEEAAYFFSSAVALDATRADTRHRHGRALQAAGKDAAAITAYTEAIGNDPTKADYYTDLSAALSDAGRFEEALAAGQAAVDLDPGCVVACNNLGHALLCLNRSAEAVVAYQRAIDGCDTYAKARLGHALALLKCGDYEHGWQEYEWRWQAGQASRPNPGGRLWRGEEIGGQTILLHAEQGLGDTLQFVRFAPLVAARGARVVLEVPPSLVRLLRGVEGVAQVVASGDPLPPIDWHCPMASLPLAFGLRLETIPAPPYVPAAEPLRDRSGFVVGLVWAGDPRRDEPALNRVDGRRSTTLEALAPLFSIDGVRFASFQFGAARGQLSAGTWPMADAMEGVTDFADTAVRLAGVDLLISVDTSMVHLAGGLGIPVWMLSRADGCWRWLERRTDTPWYPSMRIFRQASAGDWSGVIAEVGAALREIIRG